MSHYEDTENIFFSAFPLNRIFPCLKLKLFYSSKIFNGMKSRCVTICKFYVVDGQLMFGCLFPSIVGMEIFPHWSTKSCNIICIKKTSKVPSKERNKITKKLIFLLLDILFAQRTINLQSLENDWRQMYLNMVMLVRKPIYQEHMKITYL